MADLTTRLENADGGRQRPGRPFVPPFLHQSLSPQGPSRTGIFQKAEEALGHHIPDRPASRRPSAAIKVRVTLSARIGGGEDPMNLYHCLIELRPESRALAFSQACGQWMSPCKLRG